MIALSKYTITVTLREDDVEALYIARRVEDDTTVSIKVLRGEYPSPRDIARIGHEYALLQTLDVPGILRARGLEWVGQRPLLVLDVASGRPLRELLASGPLDVATALRIAAVLAATLDGIHAHRVIHKAVEPSRIFVDLAGPTVTLTDFGIATRLTEERQPAEGAVIEGALAYIAPEQTGRMNRVVDARADLYSLGVTLFEMLTGALPFAEQDPLDLIHSHIARTPLRPIDVVPTVPQIVSDVVTKLLAKDAEDRYQTGRGLKADLDACLAALEHGEASARFPLGRSDVGRDLRVPQRLYGRGAQIEALFAAFERAQSGQTEFVMVTGPPGIGKTALVREFRRALDSEPTYVGTGKIEPTDHDVPFAPLATALREVARQILSEGPTSRERWKGLLGEALGLRGHLVLDLIPELGFCPSPQPSAPSLSAIEVRSRSVAAFARFMHVVARERALVVILDDIQWVDAATLAVLELLLGAPEGARVLVVGARRDAEQTSPLREGLAALHRAGVSLSELPLPPISPESVAALVGDTLGGAAERLEELAAIIFEKTHGSPFFVRQFLRAIYKAGALALRAETSTFVWDEARVAAAAITDNVVDFLVRKMRELSPGTQRALALAACIGDQFDLRGLAAVTGAPSGAAAAVDLWEALEEGFVLPLDAGYRFFDDAATGEVSLAAARPELTPEGQALNVGYRFSHDRVRQAASSLLGPDEQRAAHLDIGRLRRADFLAEPSSEALLDMVTHLNQATPQITSKEELRALARDDLAAGRAARGRAAPEAAVGYFDAAIAIYQALDGDAAWEVSYADLYALHTERAECEYLRGGFAAAEAQYDELGRRAATEIDAASVARALITLYVTMGRFLEAVRVGREALHRLGVDLPEEPAEAERALAAELAAVAVNLAGRSPEALLDAQALDAPREEEILRLLIELWTPAQMVSPALRNLVTVKQVNVSLAHGSSELSCFGYMAYAQLLARFFNRFEEARGFSRLALALHERCPRPELTTSLSFLFGSFAHLVEPLQAVVPYLMRAYNHGLSGADLPRASYAAAFLAPIAMTLGGTLTDVEAETDRTIAVLRRRTWNELAISGLVLCRQVMRNLAGLTAGRHTLDDDDFDEGGFVASLSRSGFDYIACLYHAYKAELAFLYGDHEGAVMSAAQAVSDSARNNYVLTDIEALVFLSHAALIEGARPDVAARHHEAMAGALARMAALAENCPMNYRHRHLVMLAEQARIDGREGAAMALFDDAVEAAQSGGFLRDEAVISEVAARFYKGRGRNRIARAYLTDARHAYLRWGALAKVAALEDAAPELLLLSAPAARVDARAELVGASSAGRRADLLDVAAVIRAAQTIAGEILLDKVLDRLLRITLSNAGAQRGVLLLAEAGRLAVEATITLQPDDVRVGPRVLLEDAFAELPVSIVQHVERTGEPVVIGDAQRDPRWSADPYISREGIRSILCLAMLHHARLTGVLYLEHRAATDAFTPARIELCQLLSSQAATAVENALLYEHVQEVTEELRRANEDLERQVHRRTEQLRVELGERLRAEESRAELKEEIIRAQIERLQELSTPLIPIASGVVALPLIGIVDGERAQQVLEAALMGARKARAKVVIVDITGVRQADAEVASTLLRTGRALGLLGAEVVITGVRPEVAQTLIGLGVDLGAIVTLGTLESGIVYALERTGARLVRDIPKPRARRR
jgi:predicted ATPase/GAF domain-containing protein